MLADSADVYRLASRLAVPDLAQVAGAAGVMSVLQLSAYYSGRSLRHSVAQALEFQSGAVELRLSFEGLSLASPLRQPIKRERMDKLNAVLLKVKFSRLGDQVQLPYSGSLWLIQRAAGSHVHGIIIAPAAPELPYSAIVNAIDAYLPEAIREIPLRN